MNNSVISQHVFPELYPDDEMVRDAYESMFENPCHLYYELLKAFIKYGRKNGSTFETLFFQPEY